MFRVTVDANCVRGECIAATVYHGVATVASVVKPSTSLGQSSRRKYPYYRSYPNYYIIQ